MSEASSIQLVDCSLRDGHQSLLATRMSTEQCLRVLPLVVKAGHTVLELWGGATLDSALRFTNDDPFERLDRFRDVLRTEGARKQWTPASAGNTSALDQKFQIRSLCRGQNLFGYNPYADNVVVAFMKEAVRSANTKRTIHRMRIFDALNDARNLITPIMATKTFNGHAEAAISYTTSPIHDTDHFVNFARQALDAGADSLAIKDMAGLLHPADAFDLIEALAAEFPGVEITLHSHCTNGLAIASYVAAMITGQVHYLDTAYGPMAGATSQPPAELIVFFARELGVETHIDLSVAPQIDEKLRQIRKELAAVDKDPEHFGNPWPTQAPEELKVKIRKAIDLLKKRDKASCDEAIAIIEDDIMVHQGYPEVDRAQLESQIPGGMISNLHNQLKEQGKLDQMPAILEEVPRVRKAAGYVPLVTPTSQIVGTQAAFNVIQGEPYAFVSEPFRELIMGKYGRLPGPVDPDVLAKVSQGQEPFVGRPADRTPDVDLGKILTENPDIVKTHRDLLLLILFPGPAKTFLTKRQGG